MSFQEPPSRRERLSRLPAFAQYENNNSSYDTEPGLTDTGYPGNVGYPGQAANPGDTYYPGNTAYPGNFTYPQNADYADTAGYPGAPGQGPPWDGPPPPRRQDSYPPARVTGSFEAADNRTSVLGAELRSRGLLAGAIAGLLSAALALGVANLVAAFVRPQASPIIAVGGAFIDRTPPWLKNFAVEKFGENDKTMLLLGMYVAIALLAMGIGMTAWRHVSVGVIALALFGAFGAFVAFTRPESRTTDVIPSIAGGIAGIAAIAWLVSARQSRYALARSRFRTDRGDW